MLDPFRIYCHVVCMIQLAYSIGRTLKGVHKNKYEGL